MKAMIFYRHHTDYERTVLDYLRDFQKQTSKQLPEVDVDTSDGAQLAELYDIVKYPTIIAVDNEGKLLQTWDGELLPRVSEVSYYLEV